MRRSSLDKREQGKKSVKAVTMPDKTGGAKKQEVGGIGEGGREKAPRKSVKNPRKKEVQEEKHKGAKKALRQAVKAEVKKDRKRIAKALVNRTVQGDVRGTEMLLSLMELDNKDDKDGKKNHGGLKLIDLLESEPEWEGEEAETAAGGGAGVSKAVG